METLVRVKCVRNKVAIILSLFLISLWAFCPEQIWSLCTTLSFPNPAQKQEKAEKENPASWMENVKDGTHLNNHVKDI
jgi:hypothetical protein